MLILIYRIYGIPLPVDIVQTKTTVVTDRLVVQDMKGTGNVKLERRAGRGCLRQRGLQRGWGSSASPIPIFPCHRLHFLPGIF